MKQCCKFGLSPIKIESNEQFQCLEKSMRGSIKILKSFAVHSTLFLRFRGLFRFLDIRPQPNQGGPVPVDRFFKGGK